MTQTQTQSQAQTPTRRSLKFNDLDEAVRDAESLLTHGYERAGNWTLAQACGHMADWMRFPLDGFPQPPLPVRWVMSILKNTVMPRQLRKMLENGSMPSGGPTMRETVPKPGGDDAKAVDDFRQVVARFKAHQGPMKPSPLFGELSREDAMKLQLIHCAHHLSFLIPKNASS